MVLVAGNGSATNHKGLAVMKKKIAPVVETPKAEVPEIVVPKVRVVTAKKAVNAPLIGEGTTVYTSVGGVAYNPRATHNAEAWEKIGKVLGTSQKATHAELCAVLGEHFKYSEENHYNFLNYMVRKHHLHIVK